MAKIIPISSKEPAPDIRRVPRQGLFLEVAKSSYENLLNSEADVPGLVADTPALRTDLRLAFAYDDEIRQCWESLLSAALRVDKYLQHSNPKIVKVTTALLNEHYVHLVKMAARAWLYGYSVQECIWEKKTGGDVDGYYGYKAVIDKPFEWFFPARTGELYFYPATASGLSNLILPTSVASATGARVEVDTQFKFLLTRHNPTHNNPRGDAMLAYLFMPFFFRKVTWQFWMQFLERMGIPLLVGKGADTKAIMTALTNAVQDAVIAVPTDTDVNVVQATSQGGAFSNSEDSLIRRIQKIIIGSTLTSDTGQGGQGSKALGSVHADVRIDKVAGILDIVQPTIQTALNAFTAINFPGEVAPQLHFPQSKGLEAARASRDATLAPSLQANRLRLTVAYYQRWYGFAADELEAVPETAPAAQQGTLQNGNAAPDPQNPDGRAAAGGNNPSGDQQPANGGGQNV